MTEAMIAPEVDRHRPGARLACHVALAVITEDPRRSARRSSATAGRVRQMPARSPRKTECHSAVGVPAGAGARHRWNCLLNKLELMARRQRRRGRGRHQTAATQTVRDLVVTWATRQHLASHSPPQVDRSSTNSRSARRTARCNRKSPYYWRPVRPEGALLRLLLVTTCATIVRRGGASRPKTATGLTELTPPPADPSHDQARADMPCVAALAGMRREQITAPRLRPAETSRRRRHRRLSLYPHRGRSINAIIMEIIVVRCSTARRIAHWSSSPYTIKATPRTSPEPERHAWQARSAP